MGLEGARDSTTFIDRALHNCRRLNWDTVFQPVNDLFKPKIPPNLPDCPISAIFRTLKIQSLKITICVVV